MRKLIFLMMILLSSKAYSNDGYMYRIIDKKVYPDSTEVYMLKYLYIKNFVKYDYKESWIKDTINIKHEPNSWLCVDDTVNIVIVNKSKWSFK